MYIVWSRADNLVQGNTFTPIWGTFEIVLYTLNGAYILLSRCAELGPTCMVPGLRLP